MENLDVEFLKELLSSPIGLASEKEYYADANYISSAKKRIEVDKATTNVSEDSDQGVKLRLWDGDKFQERATSNIEEKELNDLMKEMVDTSSTSERYEDQYQLDTQRESLDKDYIPSHEIDFDEWSVEEKISKLKEFKSYIESNGTDIVNVKVIYKETLEDFIYVDENRRLYQRVPVTVLAYLAVAKTPEGEVKDHFEAFNSSGLDVFAKAEKRLSKFLERLEEKKKAHKLEGGKYKVVLSPNLAGLLAHESFGHGMEADTMMRGRALASDWVGKAIGSSKVNIVDFPAIEGVHGQLYFDQEGNIAEKTYLVDKGVVSTPIADKYSQARLGLEKSGNSRLESYDHKNYTRMTNTYFEPGESSVEDLISNVEDGIYLISASGGMEDPKTWGVQIQGCFGQRIKNGKLTQEFYDGFTMTGFLPNIIGGIEDLSKELDMEDVGFCGKGHKEWVRVSSGGPYILINEVILG